MTKMSALRGFFYGGHIINKKILNYRGIDVGEVEVTGDDEVDAMAAMELLKQKGLYKEFSKVNAIFGQANAFAHTALEIHKTSLANPGPPDFKGIAPFIVNATFATELYLKSMHAVYGHVPQGHDLLSYMEGSGRKLKQ